MRAGRKTPEERKMFDLIKKHRPSLVGFNLIPHTAGKISNGVFIKEDKSEIIIRFAWGDYLHFRPLKENEKSL